MSRLWTLAPDSIFPIRPNRITHVCSTVCIELLKICESAIAISFTAGQTTQDGHPNSDERDQALKAILLASSKLTNWYVRWSLMQYGRPVSRAEMLLKQACHWVGAMPQGKSLSSFQADFTLDVVHASALCAVGTDALLPAEILVCDQLLRGALKDALASEPGALVVTKSAASATTAGLLPIPSLLPRKADTAVSFQNSAPWALDPSAVIKRLRIVASSHQHHADIRKIKCAQHMAQHLHEYGEERHIPRWIEHASAGHTLSAIARFGFGEIISKQGSVEATLLERTPLQEDVENQIRFVHDPLVLIQHYACLQINSDYIVDCFSGQIVCIEHAGRSRLCIVNSVRRTGQSQVLFGVDLLSETFDTDQATSLDRPWPQTRTHSQEVLVYPHESGRGMWRVIVRGTSNAPTSDEVPRMIHLKRLDLRMRRNAMPIRQYRSMCLSYEVV